MLAAVNSKQRRYDPLRYMARGAELKRRARSEAAAQLRPLTGDEVLARFKQLGMRVIDQRAKRE
jgi:hypothetical protein